MAFQLDCALIRPYDVIKRIISPLQVLLFIDITNLLTVCATTKGPSKRCSASENCTLMDVLPAAFQKIDLNSGCLIIALHLLFDLHLISDFSTSPAPHYFLPS